MGIRDQGLRFEAYAQFGQNDRDSWPDVRQDVELALTKHLRERLHSLYGIEIRTEIDSIRRGSIIVLFRIFIDTVLAVSAYAGMIDSIELIRQQIIVLLDEVSDRHDIGRFLLRVEYPEHIRQQHLRRFRDLARNPEHIQRRRLLPTPTYIAFCLGCLIAVIAMTVFVRLKENSDKEPINKIVNPYPSISIILPGSPNPQGIVTDNGTQTMAVQINGQLQCVVALPEGVDSKSIEEEVRKVPMIDRMLPKLMKNSPVVIPGKSINFVTK